MDWKDLNRRDFTRLTLAAFGGAVTGAMAGCSQPTPTPTPKPAPATGTPTTTAGLPAGADNFALGERHVCRGLNTCKNKDKDGENACAGQGDCATLTHACGGTNDCKGEGGCKGTAGVNACTGKGGCEVPLMGDSWASARAVFEAKMKADGNTVGAAPDAAGA